AFVVLSGGIVSGNGSPAWAEFDGMVLTDLSTSIASHGANTIACFPNPATDRLWVDRSERPQRVSVIDATGREHQIERLQHNGRTLEVDVSSIPSGPYVLLMRSGTGVRSVRFIKA
ncbi:MAG: T9SS type A sorting domain-containing protein, partial [Bacteroidetes bacterium]|nr:T9SS type A sorting domain-containing protein [Bacteroidota bacterium]